MMKKVVGVLHKFSKSWVLKERSGTPVCLRNNELRNVPRFRGKAKMADPHENIFGSKNHGLDEGLGKRGQSLSSAEIPARQRCSLTAGGSCRVTSARRP
jgi:hypothetical protein